MSRYKDQCAMFFFLLHMFILVHAFVLPGVDESSPTVLTSREVAI